jgi:hypothetical protein
MKKSVKSQFLGYFTAFWLILTAFTIFTGFMGDNFGFYSVQVV